MEERQNSNVLAVPNEPAGHRETYRPALQENPAYGPARPLSGA
ncbi:hypothetical protein EDD34_1315 [Myceligenerans xiligouense]|uniref:Uncharacterized protein n=1 Tax=Myceligenerans xiligouense TaxID=253184 RepID=A0A3N4YMZ9_9MICO|nr:hypothetical protein EDD34_1315 [Myceligenerans xiligouense]